MSERRDPDAALAATLPSDPATQATQPAPRDAAIALVIGEKLAGRYLVRAFLGEGGMGAVYRAVDEKLGQDVALKVVRGTALDAMLRDEVRIAQRVTHPNVCRTYDLEEAGDHHFIKMEYIAGETLAARLRGGPLPVAEAVRVARAIADGLGAAHGSGIIHRDLKPNNVMLAGKRVVLMDFGIARHLEGPVDSTAGTLGYMAPEQLAGETVDERADLYALGCVLFEMLAGEPVYGGTKALELAAQHVASPVPDIRARRADTPRWLADVVAGLLAKEPAGRPAALARLRAGPRSRKGWIAAASLVALAAVGIVWRMSRPPEWQPRIVDLPAFQENGDTPRFSPDGRRIAYLSDRGTPNTFRIYVMNRDGSGDHAVTPSGIDIGAPAWTRDGKALLYYRDGVVVRHDLDTGATQALGPGLAPDDCGDGIVMIDAEHGKTRIVLRMADGTSRVLLDSVDGSASSPRCDGAGQHVVFTHGHLTSSASNDVAIVDRAGHVTELTHDHHAARGAAITRDGRTVVFAAVHDGRRRLYEVAASGGAARPLTLADDWDAAPDIAADGSAVVFDRDTTSENLWEGGGSAPPRRITAQRDTIGWIHEVPGSPLVLAEHAGDQGAEIVAIDTRDGTQRVLARGHVPFPSYDGSAVYFRGEDDETLEVVPLAGGPVREVVRPARILSGVDRPDGIYASFLDGSALRTRHIDHSGAVSTLDAPGFVIPAPSGGRRLVAQMDGRLMRILAYEPGAATPAREVTAQSLSPSWLDDHRFGYCGEDACTIVDLAGAPDVILRAPAGYLTRDAIVSRDGSRWYATPAIGNVTRHILVNFADHR